MGQNRGQLIVEYILLLVVSVGICALLTQSLVGRSEDSAGYIISGWRNINIAIGSDLGD